MKDEKLRYLISDLPKRDYGSKRRWRMEIAKLFDEVLDRIDKLEETKVTKRRPGRQKGFSPTKSESNEE